MTISGSATCVKPTTALSKSNRTAPHEVEYVGKNCIDCIIIFRHGSKST